MVFRNPLSLLHRKLAETTDGGAGSHGSGSGEVVCTAGDGLAAATAVPDASSLTGDGVLAAESAGVSRVLSDLRLLGDLTEGGTITCSVLANDSDLLGVLCHLCKVRLKKKKKKIKYKKKTKRELKIIKQKQKLLKFSKTIKQKQKKKE